MAGRIQAIELQCGDAIAAGTCSATSNTPITGLIHAIRVVYEASSAATTDVAITEDENGTTRQTFLTLTNANTTGNWYPRVQVCGATGTGLTMDGTRTLMDKFVVNANLKASVTGQTEGKSVTVTVFVEMF